MLASSALNTVVVCSGRERALVNEWLGDLPIWLIAENGLYFRKGGDLDGTKDWESTKEDVTSDPDANAWMESSSRSSSTSRSGRPTRSPRCRSTRSRGTSPTRPSSTSPTTRERRRAGGGAAISPRIAGDLRHLVKVSNTAPVEVIGHAAGRGAAVRRVQGRRAHADLGAPVWAPGDAARVGSGRGGRRDGPPRLEGFAARLRPFSPSREAPPAGGSSNDLRRSGEYAVEAAAAALAAKKLDAAHRTCSAGSALSAKGEPSNTGSPRPSNIGTEFTDATDVPPLRLPELGFVLCMGEVMARDEDVLRRR